MNLKKQIEDRLAELCICDYQIKKGHVEFSKLIRGELVLIVNRKDMAGLMWPENIWFEKAVPLIPIEDLFLT